MPTINKPFEAPVEQTLEVPQTRAQKRQAEREAASNARISKALAEADRARVTKQKNLEWQLCHKTFPVTLPEDRWDEVQTFLETECKGYFLIRWDLDKKAGKHTPSIGLMDPDDVALFNERFSD